MYCYSTHVTWICNCQTLYISINSYSHCTPLSPNIISTEDIDRKVVWCQLSSVSHSCKNVKSKWLQKEKMFKKTSVLKTQGRDREILTRWLQMRYFSNELWRHFTQPIHIIVKEQSSSKHPIIISIMLISCWIN